MPTPSRRHLQLPRLRLRRSRFSPPCSWRAPRAALRPAGTWFPPTAPGNVHVRSATSTSVGVSAWDPAQDNVRVAGYYVYGADRAAGHGHGNDLHRSRARLRRERGSGRGRVRRSTEPIAQGDDYGLDRSVPRHSAAHDAVGIPADGDDTGLDRARLDPVLRRRRCGRLRPLRGADARRDDRGAHGHTGRASLWLDVRAPGGRCRRGGQSLPVRERLRADIAVRRSPGADDSRRPRSHVENSGERLAGLVAINRRRRSGRLPRDVERGARSRGHRFEHDPFRTDVRDRVLGRGWRIRRRGERVAGGKARCLHLRLPRAVAPPPPPGDTTSPSAPTGLAASNDAGRSRLNWNASSDNVGVVGYDVYRNGTRIRRRRPRPARAASRAERRTRSRRGPRRRRERLPAGQARVSTSACSAQSPRPRRRVTPRRPRRRPGSPPRTSRRTVSLNWNASSDNVGVTGYDVYRNGTKVAPPTSTTSSQSGLTCGTSYAFASWPVTPPGTSRSGRSSTSPQRLLQVAPAAAAAAPAVGGHDASLTALEPRHLERRGRGLAHVGCATERQRRGRRLPDVRQRSPSSTARSAGATISGLACGTAYTFEVDAFDAAGNNSTRASVTGSTARAPTRSRRLPHEVVASSRTATSIALAWSASSDNVGVAGYALYRGGARWARARARRESSRVSRATRTTRSRSTRTTRRGTARRRPS